MNNSQSNNNRIGRVVLLSVLLTLLAIVILLAAVAVFGSKEQYERAKDLIPVFVSLLTPLLTATITLYLSKKD